MQGRYNHPAMFEPPAWPGCSARAFHPTSSLATQPGGLQTLIDDSVRPGAARGLGLRVVAEDSG